jgi:ERCC4-type nuclease
MLRIIIDNRDKALFDACQERIHSYENLVLEISQLSLGDIEIYYDDVLLFIWERKTFSDLLGSIKDGRYNEQSQRLSSVYGHQKIVYLIEGIINQHLTDKKIIISTITSLMFYKGFHVFRTTSLFDSAECLLITCDKIFRNKQQNKDVYYLFTQSESSYTSLIKKEKKKNITTDNIGEIFLCQIPDISHTSASAIMQFANNDFYNLMNIVIENPDSLYTITIGTEKKRKISKKVVQQIISYLKSSG